MSAADNLGDQFMARRRAQMASEGNRLLGMGLSDGWEREAEARGLDVEHLRRTGMQRPAKASTPTQPPHECRGCGKTITHENKGDLCAGYGDEHWGYTLPTRLPRR